MTLLRQQSLKTRNFELIGLNSHHKDIPTEVFEYVDKMEPNKYDLFVLEQQDFANINQFVKDYTPINNTLHIFLPLLYLNIIK